MLVKSCLLEVFGGDMDLCLANGSFEAVQPISRVGEVQRAKDRRQSFVSHVDKVTSRIECALFVVCCHTVAGPVPGQAIDANHSRTHTTIRLRLCREIAEVRWYNDQSGREIGGQLL